MGSITLSYRKTYKILRNKRAASTASQVNLQNNSQISVTVKLGYFKMPDLSVVMSPKNYIACSKLAIWGLYTCPDSYLLTYSHFLVYSSHSSEVFEVCTVRTHLCTLLTALAGKKQERNPNHAVQSIWTK